MDRLAFRHLPLVRKVALIPALAILLMGLLLAVAVQLGNRHTAALQALDRDVFESLDRALVLKDGVTLLHSRLFALLSSGGNEVDPAAQRVKARALVPMLETQAANLHQLLHRKGLVSPEIELHLRAEFAAYAARLREAATFATYDASYGALLAGVTEDRFNRLRAHLDALVQDLSERRRVLADEAVRGSVAGQRALVGLGLGAGLLALLGSAAVGSGIARPVSRLTALMNRLARGETDLQVPDTDRADEVGAMARAVEVFRDNAIARRQGEEVLWRTNMQFDAALNSMLQGMMVWGPDQKLQLVNGRFFAISGMPPDSIVPGMTARELAVVCRRNGLCAGESLEDICRALGEVTSSQRAAQLEVALRPGLMVRISSAPMANGGSVVTFEDITEKRQSEEQIAFMAHHDALTGLPNRVLFQEQLEGAVAAFGEGRHFAVLCLDLDHFKDVNDTLGHAAGDELLRLVAERLQGCVRGQDAVARLGGDEFAVLLTTALDGPAPAASLAARLVEAVGAPYTVQGHTLLIGTSIGIALPEPGCEAAGLMKQADVALYRAKEDRGTFCFFQPGMDEHLHIRRGLEAALRLALHRSEFELHYQPLYNLALDRVTGFEALLRWNSPAGGRVAPADFVPLAEQTGLIVPIGEWVLQTACAEAARWPEHLRVAVNLSPAQFKSKRLLATVQEALQSSGLPPWRLELEITETVLLQDSETVMAILHCLHGMGVRVSMDDFGTGYSSLSYLRRFPFDKIKIDRSFVCDLQGTAEGAGEPAAPASASSAAVIVRAITGLGENLGISTTAEGVETAEQFAHMRREGCTEVQGYFISPPRPAAEIAALLQRLDGMRPDDSGPEGRAPRVVPLRVA